MSDINDFVIENGVLVTYSGSDSKVIVPDGVTSIGDEAFSNCESLASIIIPNGVTSIGYSVFDGCEKLESVTIPDSVTSIGNCAFIGCYELASISIPDGVTSIGNAAFYNCKKLESVTIPDSVTSIGDEAFYGCESLASNDGFIVVKNVLHGYSGKGTSISIPDGVTKIGDEAFYGCEKLESVTIPDSVTSIGDKAFFNCEKLANVTIPDGVTSIGDEAFFNCEKLANVTIPDGVTSIGVGAFYGCESLASNDGFIVVKNVLHGYSGKGTSISIPDGVTKIGYAAFRWCNKLESVTIPDSVTSIGDEAFSYCKSLASIIIPNGVTSIGDGAFCGCEKLIVHAPTGSYAESYAKTMGCKKEFGFEYEEDDEFEDEESEIEKSARIMMSFPRTGTVKINVSTDIGNMQVGDLVILEQAETNQSIRVKGTGGIILGELKETLYYGENQEMESEISVEDLVNYVDDIEATILELSPKDNLMKINLSVKEESFVKYLTALAEETQQMMETFAEQNGIDLTNTENCKYPVAQTELAQHGHLDFIYNTQGVFAMMGGAVNVNQNGTEYEFVTINDMGIDEKLKDAIYKADRPDFPYAQKALEMAKLFRVDRDVFDVTSDREQEIESGLIKRCIQYNCFRSFAWTLSAYCSQENITPGDVEYSVLEEICKFIYECGGINYEPNSYSPVICSGEDVHVYYVPDRVSASNRKILVDNSEGVASLDGLRKELEYLYPAIQTIYEYLRTERNSQFPLEGCTEDILYVWCSMTYAAREPIFSEDGPMNCIWTHPDEFGGNLGIGDLFSRDLTLSDLPIIVPIEGTAYEGRIERIERVKVGDKLILKADWNCKYYDPVAIEVFNKFDQTLGYLCDYEYPLVSIAKIIDNVEAVVESVTPLSARRKNAKYALMDVKIVEKTTNKKSSLKSEYTLAPTKKEKIKNEFDDKKASHEPGIGRDLDKLKKRKSELEARKKELKNMFPRDKDGKKFVQNLKREYRKLRSKHYMDSYYTKGIRDLVYDDSYAIDLDNLIINYVGEYNYLLEEDVIHPSIVLEMIDEIKNVMERMEYCYIAEGFGSYKYGSCIDIIGAKKDFERIIKENKKQIKKLEKEESDILSELQDIDFALKYKVDIADVPKHRMYVDACDVMNDAKTSQAYKNAADLFGKCKDYKDSKEMVDMCLTLGKQVKAKEAAESEYKKAKATVSDMESDYATIIAELPGKENELKNVEKSIEDKKASAPAEKEKIQRKLDEQLSDFEIKIKHERTTISENNRRKNEIRKRIDKTIGLFFWIISKLKAELSEIEAENERAEAHIKSLEKQMKQSENSAKGKMTAIDNEIAELNNKRQGIKSSIKQAQEKKKFIEENLERCKKDVEEKKKILDELM